MPDKGLLKNSGAAERLSGSTEKALDLADGNSVNLCHLGNLHAVLYPTADARHVRGWNLDRRRRNRSFRLIVPGWCRRRHDPQHTRFARRWIGGRGLLIGWRADWWFRGEQGFGGLARPADLLAIIAARMRLLLSAKQDLLRTVDSFAIIERTIRQVWQAGLGAPGAIRKPALMPHNPAPPTRKWRIRGDSGKGDHGGGDIRLTAGTAVKTARNRRFWKIHAIAEMQRRSVFNGVLS
jgi:hypothetical protein